MKMGQKTIYGGNDPLKLKPGRSDPQKALLYVTRRYVTRCWKNHCRRQYNRVTTLTSQSLMHCMTGLQDSSIMIFFNDFMLVFINKALISKILYEFIFDD
jgi:hypothetical protein